MRIDILSLFPGYFQGPFDVSMIRKARQAGRIEIHQVDIRSFADPEDRHQRVDDRPVGGGPGMVLRPGPVARAIHSVRRASSHVVYLSPQGTPLKAAKCKELAQYDHLVLLCGHYEGVDERVLQREVDEEISIGDYVLTNGCVAAIVLVDAVVRFVPGVIGNPEAVEEDSFQNGIFEGPLYTREAFEGEEPPEILRSGDHAKIKKWKLDQAMRKTRLVRPELIVE